MIELKKPTAGLLTVLAIIGRLLPHLPNFTPLGGATLFGGAKLNRPWNYLLPLCVLLATDWWLGFHQTMPYVYGSFLLIVWLGECLVGSTRSLGRIAGVSALGSIFFFLITNFGVWQTGQLYPHTFAGLISAYTMGLPFLRGTLLGDVLFATGFFAVYQWAENRGVAEKVDKRVIGWLGR